MAAALAKSPELLRSETVPIQVPAASPMPGSKSGQRHFFAQAEAQG
jgi:hypothetical protein